MGAMIGGILNLPVGYQVYDVQFIFLYKRRKNLWTISG